MGVFASFNGGFTDAEVGFQLLTTAGMASWLGWKYGRIWRGLGIGALIGIGTIVLFALLTPNRRAGLGDEIIVLLVPLGALVGGLSAFFGKMFRKVSRSDGKNRS